MPFTPDEIADTAAECRAAGASIIHFHARNPDGSACYTPEGYAEIVGKIRDRADILVDCTLGVHNIKEDENRLAHIKLMGQESRTRPDFAAVDLGRDVGREPAPTDEARDMLGIPRATRALQ